MKLKTSTSHLLCLLLLWSSFAPAAQAQTSGQRARRFATPAQTQTPVVVAPTPRASAPQTTPTQQPTPQATAPPPPSAPAPRTIEELHARLQALLDEPQLASAFVGAKVASLDTGRVLFEANANKLMMPASNMKLYTVAAALDRLGPNFRFVTSVYAAQKPDANGTLHGDLIIYGRGDPTYATRFNGGDYYKAIDDLAANIAAAGVKRIEGDLVGDESYFTGPPLGPGWEWDDLQWYYAAEVSALTVDDNSLDIIVKPGTSIGASGVVTTGPATPFILMLNDAPDKNTVLPLSSLLMKRVMVLNLTKTVASGMRREININRSLALNTIVVSGQIAQDDLGYSGSVAITQPANLFTYMLRAALEQRGVAFKPAPATGSMPSHAQTPLDTTKLIEIARRESPPFSEVAAQTLKPSQNLYAELILRTLGKQFPASDPKLTTAEAGSAVVRAFLREAGVANADRLSFFDGSGLARSDLITADATLQLLTYMSRHRYAQVWRDALPIAGVDGTLRSRMKNTPAANNVRAKTGTLNNVASLSGYLTSATGEHLVFSLIVNHHPDESEARRIFLDPVAVLLASFAGHS
jgi:serine-type D-Ala-D-Ala carboxypeptidase/endopeptidase (penicillin-binding protein 4)